MHLSGQTPIFRARNLEKFLGIETIYLKLEGSNPTGHKNDRIAEALVKYAISRGYEKLLIHGSERYMRSVIYFANHFEVPCYGAITKSKLSVSKLKNSSEVTWVKINVGQGKDEMEVLEAYAQKESMFLLSEWEKKPFIRSLAIEEMMEETLFKLKAPTDIWTQVKGGYTVKSLYHELMRNWIKGNIETMPVLHCGLKAELAPSMEKILPSEGQDHQEEMSLEGIMAITRAVAHPVAYSDLVETVKMVKRYENITISAEEAYSLTALIKCETLRHGTHIVFLNDGKSDIKIQEISKDPSLNFDEIVTQTRKLLEPYNDSIEETADAVKKAIGSGFILRATRKDEVEGICIIVNMGFQTFIPTYHLAYIGVKSGNSGRGVATELINMALEKTQGKLSLHVDIPNKRAKKLYEKMGFVHCYDRMLYKG